MPHITPVPGVTFSFLFFIFSGAVDWGVGCCTYSIREAFFFFVLRRSAWRAGGGWCLVGSLVTGLAFRGDLLYT